MQPPTTVGDAKELLRITCWLQLCLRAGVYNDEPEGMSVHVGRGNMKRKCAAVDRYMRHKDCD
jgi:hypothetical protein